MITQVTEKLEKLYEFDMLIGIVDNKRLPFAIRGSFVRLLQNLWLDRYPHCAINGDQTATSSSFPSIWVLDKHQDINLDHPDAVKCFSLPMRSSLRNSSILFDKIDSPYKFVLVTEFCKHFLTSFPTQVINNRVENMCINEVLSLLDGLLYFGFVPGND